MLKKPELGEKDSDGPAVTDSLVGRMKQWARKTRAAISKVKNKRSG